MCFSTRLSSCPRTQTPAPSHSPAHATVHERCTLLSLSVAQGQHRWYDHLAPRLLYTHHSGNSVQFRVRRLSTLESISKTRLHVWRRFLTQCVTPTAPSSADHAALHVAAWLCTATVAPSVPLAAKVRLVLALLTWRCMQHAYMACLMDPAGTVWQVRGSVLTLHVPSFLAPDGTAWHI